MTTRQRQQQQQQLEIIGEGDESTAAALLAGAHRPITNHFDVVSHNAAADEASTIRVGVGVVLCVAVGLLLLMAMTIAALVMSAVALGRANKAVGASSLANSDSNSPGLPAFWDQYQAFLAQYNITLRNLQFEIDTLNNTLNARIIDVLASVFAPCNDTSLGNGNGNGGSATSLLGDQLPPRTEIFEWARVGSTYIFDDLQGGTARWPNNTAMQPSIAVSPLDSTKIMVRYFTYGDNGLQCPSQVGGYAFCFATTATPVAGDRLVRTQDTFGTFSTSNLPSDTTHQISAWRSGTLLTVGPRPVGSVFSYANGVRWYTCGILNLFGPWQDTSGMSYGCAYSDNDGASWTAPKLIQANNVPVPAHWNHSIATAKAVVDTNPASPRFGCLYLGVKMLCNGAGCPANGEMYAGMFRTCDGMQTWQFSGIETFFSVQSLEQISPAVTAGGLLHTIHMQTNYIVYSNSTDGGVTFGAPVRLDVSWNHEYVRDATSLFPDVTSKDREYPGTYVMRSVRPMPQMVSSSTGNVLHVVWQQCWAPTGSGTDSVSTNTPLRCRLRYRRSANAGANWEPIEELYDESHIVPFWPTLAISPDGQRVTVGAYLVNSQFFLPNVSSYRPEVKMSFAFLYSLDAGHNWQKTPIPLTEAFSPYSIVDYNFWYTPYEGAYAGDYVSSTFDSNGDVHFAFVDMHFASVCAAYWDYVAGPRPVLDINLDCPSANTGRMQIRWRKVQFIYNYWDAQYPPSSISTQSVANNNNNDNNNGSGEDPEKTASSLPTILLDGVPHIDGTGSAPQQHPKGSGPLT